MLTSAVKMKVISAEVFMKRKKEEFDYELAKIADIIKTAAERGHNDIEYIHERIWTRELDIKLRENGYSVKILQPGKISISW